MNFVIDELLSNLFSEGLRLAFGDPVESIRGRPRQPMPEAIKELLTSRNLMDAYDMRPSYQRNDYLGWIARAKDPESQKKRLAIMLHELASGSGYMGQPYDAKRSRRAHRSIADNR